jgi:CheY-like chemotaxis protein
MSPDRTVLVVEDEEALREELVELIAGLGHACVGCAGAGEAVAALRERGGGTMLCDLNLAGDSGADLIRRVRTVMKLGPDRLRIVAMTGHTDLMERAGRALAHHVDALLLKPVRPAELRRLLGEGLPA